MRKITLDEIINYINGPVYLHIEREKSIFDDRIGLLKNYNNVKDRGLFREYLKHQLKYITFDNMENMVIVLKREQPK